MQCQSLRQTASGLDLSGFDKWEKEALLYLYVNGGAGAQHSVEYMLANGIHIVIETEMHFGRPAWFDSDTVYVVLDDGKNKLWLFGISHGDATTETSIYGIKLLFRVFFPIYADDLPSYTKQATPYMGDTMRTTREPKLLDSPWALSNIIHEALHIEQGFALSHSIEGERLAWQAGLRVYQYLKPAEFGTGSAYTNVLNATDSMSFVQAMWDPDYKASMLAFYPEYPGGTCLGTLFWCLYLAINSR